MRTSPSAIARTTDVAACAPEFPPVPMSSGMNTASVTTCSSVDSNACSTFTVSAAATMSSRSQVPRARASRNTPASR